MSNWQRALTEWELEDETESPMTHSVGFSSFANTWLHHSTNVNHSSVLQIPQSPAFGNLHLHTGEVWSEASGQCWVSWVSLLAPSVPAAESILLTGWGWTQKIKVWKKMDSSATAGHVLLCWYVTIICLQFFYFIDTERYCAKTSGFWLHLAVFNFTLIQCKLGRAICQSPTIMADMDYQLTSFMETPGGAHTCVSSTSSAYFLWLAQASRTPVSDWTHTEERFQLSLPIEHTVCKVSSI